MGERLCVLVAAAGEPWETTALGVMSGPDLVVLKRCVDLPDLLASAATGQADVAVLAGSLVGLDAESVTELLRHDVRSLAVGGDAETMARLGVLTTVAPDEVTELAEAVRRTGSRTVVADPAPSAEPVLPVTGVGGRVIAVHGPTGAPGRTTVALGIAAARAHGGARAGAVAGSATVLIDADPYGGSLAQHLGVLDEVSGLLAAARLVNAGALDADSFARCRRAVAPCLDLLTGLPRADRWVEVRAGSMAAILERSVQVGDVVVDTGFSLEEGEWGRSTGRNQLTLDVLGEADEVLVVGSAEPTGLARLARTLVELDGVTAAPVRVVVNRMRDTLGWNRRDITGMVEGYTRPLGVHFLPEDRTAVDRALVSGRSLVETRGSALRQALDELTGFVFGVAAQAPKSR